MERFFEVIYYITRPTFHIVKKILFPKWRSLSYKSWFCVFFVLGVFFLYYPQQLRNRGESNSITQNVSGCTPARKIAFIKTYKCGTTTLFGLLIRYAAKANLTRQEVNTDKLKLGPFNRTYVTNPSVKGDFMVDHIIWNRDEVVALLGPSVVAFTILRDPYSLFESYFSYANLEKDVGLDIKGFIDLLRQNDPATWYSNATTTRKHIMDGLYGHSLTHNLGMPYDSLHDDQAIDNHIAKLEKEMDLVMITERMEESLILFRHLMCWQPEDIVTFDQNVRRSSSVAKLDDDDKKELKRWLKADEKIYNHFYKIFEDKVAKYPGDIKREIQQRIDAREELRADCISNHEKNTACHGFNTLVAETRDNLI